MILKKPESWNLEEWIEAQVKIKELSVRKTFHFMAYDVCSKYDRYLNLPIVLLTSLVSTMAISQTSSSDDKRNTSTDYIISSISLLITLLTSVNKYFNYAEAKESHRQAALNYLRLRSELAEKISQSKNDDDNTNNNNNNNNNTNTNNNNNSRVIMISYSNFMKLYYTKFLSIRENTLTLPEKIRKEMDKICKEKCDKLKNKIRQQNGSMVFNTNQTNEVQDSPV